MYTTTEINRNIVINISNKIIHNKLTIDDVSYLIVTYCTDRSKPLDKSIVFATILVRTGQYQPYFLTALEWFKIKFTITTVLNSDGKQLLFI